MNIKLHKCGPFELGNLSTLFNCLEMPLNQVLSLLDTFRLLYSFQDSTVVVVSKAIVFKFNTSQRLIQMQIYQLQDILLSNQHLNHASLEYVYALMGPTTPGQLTDPTYTLSYPNMDFEFEGNFETSKTPLQDIPFKLADGTQPRLCRVMMSKPDPILPKFMYQDATFSYQNQVLSLGASPQTFLQLLKKPDCVFSPKARSTPFYTPRSTVWSYKDWGLDIVFKNHAACQFVLHCNIPHHFDFNKYNKCLFELHIKLSNQKVVKLDSDSLWSPTLFKEALLGQPVIYNKQSENPFGTTRFFGIPGFVFQVTSQNQIASVILY